MRRSLKIAAAALGLLATTALSGCESKRVWLELQGFTNMAGLWLWRYSDALGGYQRECEISFQDLTVNQAGREFLHYVQLCDGEEIGLQMASPIQRQADSDIVSIGLDYMRLPEAGDYKVSSYGAEGESALSRTTLQL